MAAGKLEVDITARLDKLDKGLAQAERMVKKTGGTIDSAMATPTGRVALGMGKVLGSMAALELGVASVNAGFDGLKGATALFAGDVEKADEHFISMGEVVKQLPAGIGPLAQKVEQLVLNLMGVQEQLDEQARTAERSLQRQSIAQRIDEQRESNRLLERELEVLKIEDPLLKAKAELRLEETRILKKLGADVDALNNLQEVGSEGLQFQLREEAALRIKVLRVQEQQLEAEHERAQREQQAADAEAKRLQLLERIRRMELFESTVQTAQTAMGTFRFAPQVDRQQDDSSRALDSIETLLMNTLPRIHGALSRLGFQ
jgi:hypothetical protein